MSQARNRQVQDTKRALLDARQEAVRASQHPDATGERPRSSLLRWLLLLTVLGAGYLYLARPAWFVTPPPPPEPLAVAEASLRIAVWQTAVRVRAYAEEHARLPATLTEAGAPLYAGVDYEVAGDGVYSIHGTSDRNEVVYRSSESLDTFLGNSLTVVARRRAQ